MKDIRMKTIRGAGGQAIVWAGRWEYVLRSGQEIIGMLHVEEKHGMSAVAESADGRWRFRKTWRRSGFA